MSRKRKTFWDFADNHPISAYCIVFCITTAVVNLIRDFRDRDRDEEDDVPDPD